MIEWIFRALSMAFAMGWEILWPLILGFTLSGVVQAVVSHSEMSRLLPDDRPRSIAIALGLGAASSSCSYAAVALARSIFRKGANFTAAMAFQLASTNLVIELSIIIIVLMGWQFALAEFVGAFIMVAVMVLLFRMFLSPRLVREAKEQALDGTDGGRPARQLSEEVRTRQLATVAVRDPRRTISSPLPTAISAVTIPRNRRRVCRCSTSALSSSLI